MLLPMVVLSVPFACPEQSLLSLGPESRSRADALSCLSVVEIALPPSMHGLRLFRVYAGRIS